jgi:NitT/TauT family transport system ATP-binding protein
VGPSGCGKSTLLKIIAGLDHFSAGEFDVWHREGKDQPINNVIFQEYAIFPWRTVLENVAFGLEMRGISKKIRTEIARDWLQKVGLSKFANYFPDQISGGMKQRVAIIRALANDPEILLMDEPLGALDAQSRLLIQEELLKLWDETKKTVLYVTHSLDEAIFLGDEVLLMSANPGQIIERYPITIERPRSISTINSRDFTRIRSEIWDKLAVEVDRSMASQQ